MTKGACISRMEKLKELWKTFDENHNDLLEDESSDSKDPYLSLNMHGSTVERFFTRLGMFRDYLYSLETHYLASY